MANIESVQHMKIKKLNPEAVLPTQANSGDIGYDVVSITDPIWSEDGTYIEYDTGIAIELPLNFHIELFPRSSVTKYDLVLGNSIGLVDNSYRGSIRFRFKYIPRFEVIDGALEQKPPILYKKGDKVGQIVIRADVLGFRVKEVSELSDTARGSGGFGSTGR